MDNNTVDPRAFAAIDRLDRDKMLREVAPSGRWSQYIDRAQSPDATHRADAAEFQNRASRAMQTLRAGIDPDARAPMVTTNKDTVREELAAARRIRLGYDTTAKLEPGYRMDAPQAQARHTEAAHVRPEAPEVRARETAMLRLRMSL